MAGVFISYAREDAPKAQAIARALEQASFDVWFDQRIHSGSEFSREIEEALRSASAVVVLWSRSSVESAWVRDEAAEGRDSGRLVPVLLDDARPPIGFRQFQTTDLSHWSGRGGRKRLAGVIAAVGAKAGAPSVSAAKPARAPGRWWRRPAALAVAGAIALVLAASAAWFFGGTRNQPASLSVALLPFTADASDPDARRLAASTHEAVAHTLSQGAFAVSTIDAAPQGARARADFLISGQLTSTAQKFVATVRMEETQHHVVVFSHQFEADRSKADTFPELIGAQVASQLSWTAPLLALERRHPSDPAIVAALLQSGTSGDSDDVGTLRDYETARRLAAEAPTSPLAQNSLAFNTAFALGQIPRDERAGAVAAARRAADRTTEIAPDYGSGYVPWCLLHSSVRMLECEDRLRAGMRADADDPFANWFLSRLLNNVGRNAEAVQLASLSLAHDRYMPLKIAEMLRLLEVNGRSDEAAKLYRQSTVWWPANEATTRFRLTGMMQRGDFEAMQRFGEEVGGAAKPSAALVAINRKALPNIQQACAAPPEPDATLCMLALARFGDLDAAFRLADRLYPSVVGRTRSDEDRIWLDRPDEYPSSFLASPAAAPLRADPRYVALAQRVGLFAYWRNGRLPDFCRTNAEPICSRLRRA
ncbi:MAG: TIR domain-containing protein [Sphingomicrobium sp.]